MERGARRELAFREVVVKGGRLEIEPTQALLDCVYRAAGQAAWLREKGESLRSGRGVVRGCARSADAAYVDPAGSTKRLTASDGSRRRRSTLGVAEANQDHGPGRCEDRGGVGGRDRAVGVAGGGAGGDGAVGSCKGSPWWSRQMTKPEDPGAAITITADEQAIIVTRRLGGEARA